MAWKIGKTKTDSGLCRKYNGKVLLIETVGKAPIKNGN